MMELKRTELLIKLDRMSESGSLLVVGGPGAGKSWILRQFAARRIDAGDAATLILAEEHNFVESIKQLEESLRTPAGIIPTLKAYVGPRRFLIIDSLDALRAETSQRVFRQLIRQVHRELPDWKVIASIRSFDAKESIELRSLFPPEMGDTQDFGVRHLLVPSFNDEELSEAEKQDERLAPIFASASTALREILRNAFNLWLVIHLLDEKLGVEWLYEIESEVQLFERYWHFRIAGRDDSYDRLSVLSSISSEMVDSKTLSISFKEAYKTVGASRTFQSLLSDEVLRRTQTQRIAYAHNILFDFSVAKLLLDEESLFTFLGTPDHSVFFRPSLSYFLALLWYRDRRTFWSVTARFFAPDSKLPARVHVLPGMAIFNLAINNQELEPLFALPGSIGVDAILSVLRSIQAFEGMKSPRSSLWVYLICQLSDQLNIDFLNEYLALIDTASRERTWKTEENRRLAAASIRLLTWMWEEAKSCESEDAADQLLSIAAGRVIPLVMRFYSVEPNDVRATLQQVLNRIGTADASASEAYSLANGIDMVIDADPSFAADIYARIFAHEEKSQKTTRIGGSKVLVLTSTRAQDYSMAYYVLGVRFAHFLRQDLKCATVAAIRAVSAQVGRDHPHAASKIGKYSTVFSYAGIKSRLIADRSEIWDQGHRDVVSLQMLDALLNRLSEGLKSGEFTQGTVWPIFHLIAEENRFPVVWKRVIEHATQKPELVPFAVPLLREPEILAAPETTVVSGEFINRSFETFTMAEKQEIESAILAVPEMKLAKVYESPKVQRDRLLGCIPENELSAKAKSMVRAAKSEGTLVGNQPFFKIGSVSQMAITDESWLQRCGVDANADQNRKLLEVKPQLAAFEDKYVNEIPPNDEINNILPPLRVGYERVTNATGADEAVITDVLTSLAAVAKSIARNNDLDRENPAAQLCREIIIHSAVYPYPTVSEDADDNFDTPSWGPTPKTEAAQAVGPYISTYGLDSEFEDLILVLSSDKSPAVRFLIADGLWNVYNQKPKLFWQVANSMQRTERATGVLVSLARIVGQAYIAKREPANVLRWFKALLKRGLPERRAENVFDVILDSLIFLYIFLNEGEANSLLRGLEKAPARYAGQLPTIATYASYYLAYKVGSSDPSANEVRARAREVELRVLAAVDRGFRAMEARPNVSNRSLKKRSERVKQLLLAVDRLVFRLHVMINADPKLARPEDKSLGDELVGILFQETASVWDAVVSADGDYRRPMGPSTAHQLMESFNRLLPFDPERILRLAWWLITGRTMGYQFDAMAVGEFVTFTEKILADHKGLLRDAVNISRFSEILDVFAKAGWPEATRIVLRMDSAVR